MDYADLHAGYEQGDIDTKKCNERKILRRTITENVSSDQHCHMDTERNAIDRVARRKLIVASCLCLFFMIGEATGGAIAHSLAIMTDAAHLLTDFASFLISLFAIYLASRPATKRMSFGWYRAGKITFTNFFIMSTLRTVSVK
ncbi:unnamed protein product [Dibothriocephalus latus]|uniref:Cation efflux protein transmembrane domain-containing protein n=1 Tax=Dibothriocephalus latus TaxID=60516 RepID=A0A3P7M140_DIBLA|nr:unnamed protein product [Dibothriocephalus latus]